MRTKSRKKGKSSIAILTVRKLLASFGSFRVLLGVFAVICGVLSEPLHAQIPDERSMALREQIVEIFGTAEEVSMFKKPPQSLTMMGMGPRDIYVQVFTEAVSSGLTGRQAPQITRQKMMNSGLFSLLMMIPGYERILKERATTEMAKRATLNDDYYDDLAKGGMAFAKSLVRIYFPQDADQFDSWPPEAKAGKLFQTVNNVLEGQALPTPYILYLLDLGGPRNRGSGGRSWAEQAFGSTDQRVLNWNNLGTEGQYKAIQDGMKAFYSEGARALVGSQEEANHFLAQFVGKTNVPEDKLILQALGKEARAQFLALKSDDPRRQRMFQTAGAMSNAWLTMTYCLIGAQAPPASQ